MTYLERAIAAGVLGLTVATAVAAQAPSRPAAHGGQAGAKATAVGWRYWGSDAKSTRYAPLDQIDASNFGKLEVAWVWRGDNYSPEGEALLRATPIYAEGKLFSVAGTRRTVVAIDPSTGETLWTYREPTTKRWKDSMRKDYGKGVAYDVVDGKGRVYVVTPAFFLHALDAETGRPIATFGKNGTVDLLDNLGPWPHDWDKGLPEKIGYITSSSPPIVVNGVIVVGNSHEQGYYETMKENVPGNILAYDTRTGKHLWKFNVIPQPGEFGHDTWKNDAWKWTGNVSTWAPISADLERNIVYVSTDPPSIDYFGGFRPGNTLFATSIIALNASTGKRLWHFQTVHHDIWNYDNPHAPQLVDITVGGKRIPALVQVTKQSWAYVLNRVTGEPVWPIEERAVPQSSVPGEATSPTQPFVTRPAAFEMQGLTTDDLIDFTPELRKKALDLMSKFKLGPLFNPPGVKGANGLEAWIHCPGANGGANIPGGAAIDPESAILYVASTKDCSAPRLVPGKSVDSLSDVDFVSVGPGGIPGIDGLPILKPPYGRITAIDLNTGEHLWWITNGDTPDDIKDNKWVKGIDVGRTGARSHATALVTKTLLIYGEGRGARPLFHAVDKKSGKELATAAIPGRTTTAPMTFMHEGQQYLVSAIEGPDLPGGALVALRLPNGAAKTSTPH